MKYSFERSASCAAGLLLTLCLAALAAPAQIKHPQTSSDASQHPRAAAKVFTEIMKAPKMAIPKESVDKAKVVAVFPEVVKAAFIFGGRGGQGVISRRTSHGWSAPAFFSLGGAKSQQSTQTNKAKRDGMPLSTDRIAREVRHELLLLPYYNVFDWLEFQVAADGTVVLRGQVVSPPDTKANAEAAVKDVEGVKRVVNQIEVLPLSPNDSRLREALYRAIYSGPLFRYAVGSLNTIHIIVKNGRATLKGEVDSRMDKQLASAQARGVSGVFEVTDELTVRNERPR